MTDNFDPQIYMKSTLFWIKNKKRLKYSNRHTSFGQESGEQLVGIRE
jgi:hypothetical protein